MTREQLIDEKTKDSNGFFWGAFSEDRTNPMFFIADKNFNVLFTCPAFIKGHFTTEVKEALSKYGISEEASRMRTDENIEALKHSIEVEYRIYKLYQKRTT